MIILIGGAPTVGKSYLAKKLGKELKLPWISTDAIRGNMRKTVTNRGDYPHLFDFKERDAVPYLNAHTPQEIVDHTNLENMQVWRGVVDFIDEGSFGDSYIIEGMAILPKEAALLMKKDTRIRSLFLVDHNIGRLRDIIYTRGLWDDAFKYSDTVKEKELQWVLLFNDWIEKECAIHKLHAVTNKGQDPIFYPEAKEYITGTISPT